jgi:hypothetical protein
VAIFALVAGTYGWVNTFLGCNGKFNGIMETWRGVDLYLQRADQYLCSPQCPCKLTNFTDFSTNQTVAPFYNLWNKDLTVGNTAFQNCSSQVQQRAYDEAAAGDVYFDPQKNFNQQRFAEYMARVENDFQCAGWCNVTYINTDTGNRMVMFKYLFTDVNRGPPQRLGCLDSVITWLPPYLQAFGSVALVLAAFQV